MRLATITNWAYGTTVVLTLVSGATMILASNAQEQERAQVAQRYRLDRATERLSEELYVLTGQTRQYVITGDETHISVYQREARALADINGRLSKVSDAGALPSELNALRDALKWAETLHDKQLAAIAASKAGQEDKARQIIFGAEYERELDRAEAFLDKFQYQVDQRIAANIDDATAIARAWRTISEILLGSTAFLFLCVLYFVFKQRVLRPVVRLSDVISRLAAQDYEVETPAYDQIDEIGDMAQAIRIFRENGLQRQRLEEERDRDRAVRDTLSRMTQRMQGCDTPREIGGVAERFIPVIAPRFAGALYLLDQSRNVMTRLSSWSEPTHSLAEFPTISCWALRRGTFHRPSGTALDIPCNHVIQGDTSVDTICIPLTAQDETLGLLYFEAIDSLKVEQKARDVYLNMLAENIALALANLHLRDALRASALTDPLTGLGNRRSLDKVLEQVAANTLKAGHPLSCLMLDVDNFKRFNDSHGHDAGDAILRQVGASLRDFTRDGALAFRYGGEEFVLLLPDVDLRTAVERAEEIRTHIASVRISFSGREVGPVTVSIGVATSPDLETWTDLIATADSALLRAKQAGRNRVVVANRRTGEAPAG
ncbi:diguanylate cyclase [Altererythrobacter sp. FM1]|uniref:sensor domain-containing diguanylate cyclase n=1 Tax=Tsuneonella flava TaxID=2055955 RepID=UPI000C80FDDB|nr:sensor domain-containing diguanylate cyclase [Tsuneonella flava]ROT93945.1 diguanylate cyclase [Altererythrobacter sp. FM1]